MRPLDSKAEIARGGVRPGAAALSWALWLAAVLAFALWSQASYRPPIAPAWLGLTIHVGVFAAWALLAREWAAIRLAAADGR